MAKSASSGPLIVFGQETLAPGFPKISGNRNPDAGPSLFAFGTAISDIRPQYAYNPGGADNQKAFGWINSDVLALEAVPSAKATANIAALQAPNSGTPLTLVAASGAGITVGDSVVNAATGLTVTGLRRIDQFPSATAFGSNALVNIWDPTTLLSRAVSLTSAANLSAITFTVAGFDIYGNPQTEAITGPNANTVNGKKTWKWIQSVTPSATSGSTVSVGTADIFGFPLRVDKFFFAYIVWNNVLQLVSTFTAADANTPTTTTGDVRGTFTSPDASDGTKRLQVSITIPAASLATVAGTYGVTPA